MLKGEEKIVKSKIVKSKIVDTIALVFDKFESVDVVFSILIVSQLRLGRRGPTGSEGSCGILASATGFLSEIVVSRNLERNRRSFEAVFS